MTSSDVWDDEAAQRYDETSAAMFAPEVLDPAVALLAELADGGPALEFAVGTGRVAVPLVVGDMATTRVPGDFSLVYLVWNGIGNLRTQDEQVECFRNAARHLRPGGRFVVELWVPTLRRLPPGQVAVPFDVSEGHLGVDTLDVVTQRGTSHHYWPGPDGRARYGASNFRYVWPAELDLMARLAGMVLENRYADWDRSPFTAHSESHVSVWRRP